MLGTELWFLLAVLSAVAGGLFIFTAKVAAERKYDIVVFSTIALIWSAVLTFSVVVYRGEYGGISNFVLLMIAGNAIGYMWVNVLRHQALQCIDTAVYYPIYKTLTPALAIIAGFLLFFERFTLYEWFGLGISLLVPLMLITHAEKFRQKNLLRGLRLLVGAAILATASAGFVKAGTDVAENTWLFIALTDTAVACVGMLVLWYHNGKRPIRARLASLRNPSFVWLAFWMGTLSAVAYTMLVFAFKFGTFSIVYTINSLYILIPIILSIIYYHEHWNVRKVAAIVLSIMALALLK